METTVDSKESIRLSKYARYIPKLKRFETWDEQASRLFDFCKKVSPLWKEIRNEKRSR